MKEKLKRVECIRKIENLKLKEAFEDCTDHESDQHNNYNTADNKNDIDDVNEDYINKDK
jgi:hypothetical protein